MVHLAITWVILIITIITGLKDILVTAEACHKEDRNVKMSELFSFLTWALACSALAVFIMSKLFT